MCDRHEIGVSRQNAGGYITNTHSPTPPKHSHTLFFSMQTGARPSNILNGFIDFHVTCVCVRLSALCGVSAEKGFLCREFRIWYITILYVRLYVHHTTSRRSLMHFCDFIAIGLCRERAPCSHS